MGCVAVWCGVVVVEIRGLGSLWKTGSRVQSAFLAGDAEGGNEQGTGAGNGTIINRSRLLLG